MKKKHPPAFFTKMSEIYYPSLDEFWPAIRATNFVKALGGKPTNYEENMAFLAERAGVDVRQMDMVNPLTFADRNGLTSRLHTMINRDTIENLDDIRHKKWHSSSKWAYAMNQPIPPYDEWAKEKLTIQRVMEKFTKATDEEYRVSLMDWLFSYFQTIPHFLLQNLEFYELAVSKVAEMKLSPFRHIINDVILETEAFLDLL